jgi:hypothetical protein
MRKWSVEIWLLNISIWQTAARNGCDAVVIGQENM